MKREFGQLSHWWNGSFEQVKGYFAMRKYNGWSALWDGGITTGMTTEKIPWYRKKKLQMSTGLWSLGRDNNPDVVNAPAEFIAKLPQGIPVHGELWYKDRLDIIKTTCGTKRWFDPMWGNIIFMAFNIKPYISWFESTLDYEVWLTQSKIPDTFDDYNYTKSYYHLQGHIESYPNSVLNLAVAIKINNVEDLKQIQETSVKHKWEGLIFANPNGKYQCGRSYNSLKWKAKCDNKAIILDYVEGKTGSRISKVASIKAHLVWDEQILSLFGGQPWMIGKEVIFKIAGLDGDEIEWDMCKKKYPIGEVINFTFFGVTHLGVPQSCNVKRD